MTTVINDFSHQKGYAMLTANYLYAGFSDYFGGHGCADNEYLLYAYYGRYTTLQEIIGQLVDDSDMGSASEELPEEITNFDVHKALLDMLSIQGRKDYYEGVIAECSADLERLDECPDCGDDLPKEDSDECENCGKGLYDDESPIFVVVLHYEKEE